MSQTKPGYYDDRDCDGDGISLGATLLFTGTGAGTTTTSFSGKYARFWRRSRLVVGIFISLKKKPLDHQSPVPSPSSSIPYVPPLPPLSSDQLPRTSSSQSRHTIDIHSDNEEGEVDDEQLLRESIARIVKEKDLESLKQFGGVKRIASILTSNSEAGIHGGQLHETNPVWGKIFIYNFLKACYSYTIFMLLISAVLSFVIEITEQGPQYGWHDGVAILIAVFLLVTFTSGGNFLRERKLQKLWKKKNQQQIEVVNVTNGESKFITVSDLAMGDLVPLKKGDTVLADGLFVDGEALVVDEVMNSKVDCETNPFLFSGWRVIEGHGSMLVITVGANTTSGQMMGSEFWAPKEKTFLKDQIEKPISYIENLALFVSIIIAFVILVRLLCRGQHENDDILPELKGNSSLDVLMKIFESIFIRPRGRVRILTGVLTAIVIGIQQGMPFVITVSLSFWDEKVELYQVKPQNLSACATMGLATVICIDATGGLMCNQMEVDRFFIGEEDMKNDVQSETGQVVLESLRQGIAVSIVPEIFVTPTSHSIATWAKSRWDINVESLGQCSSVLEHVRLGSNNNISRDVIKKIGDNEEIQHLHLNGDASTVLSFCSHYYDNMGEIRDVENLRVHFKQMIEQMENNGLTVVAFACKQIETPEFSEVGSRLLAIAGLKYSWHEIVQVLQNDGVSIKLVSKDKLSAVREIAHKRGILPAPGSNDVQLEGEQIRDPTDHERIKKIEEATVMGSCLSEDMLLVVQSLQEGGHVVAFLGGLTSSEAPTLKKADIGITKGSQCTELARESCDIVISDDRSIPEVLKLGRCAYYNIQKFIQLQLTTCISGSLINLVAAFSFWESPITAIQLIWLSSIICLLGGLMMLMELRSHELMANPPAKRTKPLITKGIWIVTASQVLSQTSILLNLHLVGKAIHSMDEEVWKSLVFNGFVLCQIFNLLKAMGILRKETLKALLHHRWFVPALGAVMILQVLIVEYAGSLAGCERLNVVHWAISFIIAPLSWGFGSALEFVSTSISKGFVRSDGSHPGFSRGWPLSPSLVSISLSICLYSLSYYFYPDNAQAFRRL
ncbi:hypothetical protein P3X46_018087 [Hevea brasiliensis]|uniref:Cation-transporting P-type ATPase N-terminal domain-containing protein n=1 Tax=Hevea brasiliensis TaxID=3981 RepID=A0ABQ9LPP3_HEVBR|nr:calcium-transporting ATPase 12, plasma membrane-type-like [Hevea brasiliensis]KAJ9169946.1 hypothetical protein P3X46_018087 [Hevea brasiliensis]